MWFPAQNTQMRKPGKIALCEDTSPHTWVLLNNFCAITYVSHPNHLVHFTYTHKKLKLILIKQNLIHFGEKVFLTNFFSYFMFYDFAHCIDPHLFTAGLLKNWKRYKTIWQFQVVKNFFNVEGLNTQLLSILKSIWRSKYQKYFLHFFKAKWPTVHTCSAFIRGGLLLECLSQSCFLVSTSRSWIFFCLEAIDKWIDEFWWI